MHDYPSTAYPSTARKIAYGVAAFAFVFSASAAGSLFMITGGFGGIGRSLPANPPAINYASESFEASPDWYDDEPLPHRTSSDEAASPSRALSFANTPPEGDHRPALVTLGAEDVALDETSTPPEAEDAIGVSDLAFEKAAADVQDDFTPEAEQAAIF